MDPDQQYRAALNHATRSTCTTQKEHDAMIKQLVIDLTLDGMPKGPTATSAEIAQYAYSIKDNPSKVAGCLASLSEPLRQIATIEDLLVRFAGQRYRKWIPRQEDAIARLTLLNKTALWSWQTSDHPDIVETREGMEGKRDGERQENYRARYKRNTDAMTAQHNALALYEYARHMLTAVSALQPPTLPYSLPESDSEVPWWYNHADNIPQLPVELQEELDTVCADLRRTPDKYEYFVDQEKSHFSYHPPLSSLYPQDLVPFSPFYKVRNRNVNSHAQVEMTGTSHYSSEAIADLASAEADSLDLNSIEFTLASLTEGQQERALEEYLNQADNLWKVCVSQSESLALDEYVWRVRTVLGLVILTMTGEKRDIWSNESPTIARMQNSPLMNEDSQSEELKRANTFEVASILYRSAKVMTDDTGHFDPKCKVYTVAAQNPSWKHWWNDPNKVNGIPEAVEYISEVQCRQSALTGFREGDEASLEYGDLFAYQNGPFPDPEMCESIF